VGVGKLQGIACEPGVDVRPEKWVLGAGGGGHLAVGMGIYGHWVTIGMWTVSMSRRSVDCERE
jgi:hypothetical protein